MLASHPAQSPMMSLGNGKPNRAQYPSGPPGFLGLPNNSSDYSQVPRVRSPSLSPKPSLPQFSGQPRRVSPPTHPSMPPQQRRPSPGSMHPPMGPNGGPPMQMSMPMPMPMHNGGPPMSMPMHRPVPNPATAFPSFTAGRTFASEAQLQNIINWQTVVSKNLFDDPPTFQSLLIFLLPSVPSPAVNNFVRQIQNTPDHITHLQKCWDILKRDDREELISFGLPDNIGEIRFEIYRMWLMVRLAWRIVQALKNAKGGSRISEIGEWVMHVIETNKSVSPEKYDPLPLQTLACALTYPHPSITSNARVVRDTVTPLKRADRDQMALEYFELGFPQNNDTTLFLPSSIYAKAHQARLLRRLNRIAEAEAVENSVRGWWMKIGYTMMAKAQFTDLVCCDGEAPYDNIILKNLNGFFKRRSGDGSSTGGEEIEPRSGRDSGVDHLIPATSEILFSTTASFTTTFSKPIQHITFLTPKHSGTTTIKNLLTSSARIVAASDTNIPHDRPPSRDSTSARAGSRSTRTRPILPPQSN
ncbi:hypothetical protein Dda_4579 [Drechslerella dactyloides]|uniref:Uncharacterized protein n=1 Tax=Drechslerella dactyloides TaxID=74499 RepID=A0AAD6IX84_DREDA|nr:hypothetical protein Dda_4579 [Drechslerella dactyloides]